MRTKFLAIIVSIFFVGIFVVLFDSNIIKDMEDQKTCEQIDGRWNVDHCLITQELFDSNNLTCDPGHVLENGKCSSGGITLVIESESVDDFEKTWGGTGNRHPAFLGFNIPEICTEDMIKHLVRYSTMFDRNAPYSLEWISMDDNINRDNFDRCVEELLEKNPKELQNENIFHGKSLSYWKNLDKDSLVDYYENLGNHEENFFEDLGVFLITSHSEEKLHELGITHADEIEIDWNGIRPSLPPRMGFDAKVNSTDDKSYLITGTIRGNVIQDNFQITEDNGRQIGWTPAFEYSRVQITGTTALQICSIMQITCIENPVWDAIHRHDKDFTYFHYDTYGAESDVQIGEYYIQIDKDQVCHSFEDLLSRQISELECQEIRK